MSRTGRLRGDEQPAPAASLRDLTLLADGERGALLTSRGDVVWMCAPRWHDAAVFAGLIGGPGHFSVSPRARFKPGGAYLDGTLIWRDDWVTDDGVVTSLAALAMPAELDRLAILRRFTGTRPGMELDVRIDVRPGFGADRIRDLRRDDHGRWTASAGASHLRVTGVGHARVEDGTLGAVLVLDGPPSDLVLELSTHPLPHPEDPEDLWRATTAAWNSRPRPSSASAAPRDSAVAAAVLRGMTSSSGGMVAAATLGLPEHDGGARNYDYRYSWIRDQCYAGVAGGIAELDDVLDAAVGFVSERLLEDGALTRPAYTVDGGEVPTAVPVRVQGYPGAQAVAGNAARHQFQLDMFGEALRLFATAATRDRMDAAAWKAVDVATDVIGTSWQRADAGIWELEDRWWTHSRLECVAGLRAVARAHGRPGRREDLERLAATIADATTRRCLAADGVWVRSPDDPGTDPALLWPLVVDSGAPQLPGVDATLHRVITTLSDDGYAFRGLGDGPIGSTEGAFLLCGFVVSLALFRTGRDTTSLRWFERNRAASGSPGLFTEEFDTRQRQLKGNLPQAFVHAALLHTSTELGPGLDAWPPRLGTDEEEDA